MIWKLCLIVALLSLAGSVLLACIKGKIKHRFWRVIGTSRILFVGVIITSVTLFVPICYENFKVGDVGFWESALAFFETGLISVHNMVRLFVADVEFSVITSSVSDQPYVVELAYSAIFTTLFITAPFLTFGFILSFFKNASAYRRYITHYRTDAFIFSRLNERSLTLAESLNIGKRLIVFTDVFEDSESLELVEKARELGAICFKKDINTVNLSFHSAKKELNFFAICEDQAENIGSALKIIETYKNRKNTSLYVFSTQTEAELLLANAFDGEDNSVALKVRRVNEVQSLINRNLYENGYEKIFSSAHPDGDGVKRINAVVVGMGQHGIEMTKALAWFCQMDGYEVEINSFDIDGKAEDKFLSLCPELMAFSGKTDIHGESRYKITVHSGIDVDTAEFDRIIENLPRTTYVFVALGNDEKNISVAVKLRAIFERMKYDTVIQAVVYNTEKKEALQGIKNFKGMPYRIDFIGDMKSSYSEKVILGSDVEAEALSRHMKWGKESDFWRYDYNYRSSIASAIHKRMKVLCGMPGIEKEPTERLEKELWDLRILEHRRWNAYMRAEGYVYGGTVEKEGRNDLAKTHNCLVPFDMLPLKEQEKDDD